MHMNKFLIFMGLTTLLTGCGGNFHLDLTDSGIPATANPSNVEESFLYSTALYGSDDGGPRANIAVLLPTTGAAKTHGNSIKTAIEITVIPITRNNLLRDLRISDGDLLNLLAFVCNELAKQSAPTLFALI